MTGQTKQQTAAALAQHVADGNALFNGDETSMRVQVARGAPRLVVVTGDNASGKSLYVRCVAAVFQRDGGRPITVSIRERTGAGLDEMAGMRRIMMFGDDSDQSTGATSVKATKAAFNNLDRPEGSALILDEPEMGLSEAYSRALGEFIGQQALNVPSVCAGVLVVTHSRALVRGLIAGYGQLPTHASVSADAPAVADLNGWLDAVEHRSVEQLLALRDEGLDRWRTVTKILEARRK